jgi:cytochrome c biogenesis protein CcdA
VLGLVLLVFSIGVADSVNPSTVGPALYLSLREDAARQLSAFTAGVFGVYLLGGIVLTLGPARALPHPGPHGRHLVEVGLGVALLVFAAALWVARGLVAHHLAHSQNRVGRAPFLLGAGIMAVELPTAFPYFAAIAAIAASGRSRTEEIALLVLFNVLFVAPLLAMIALRGLAGERGRQSLDSLRMWLDRRAPVFLPALIFVIAVALLLVGGIGLATG